MVYRKKARAARKKVHTGIRNVNTVGKMLPKSTQKAIVNKANKITRKVPKGVRNVVSKEIKTALASERRKPVPRRKKPAMTSTVMRPAVIV